VGATSPVVVRRALASDAAAIAAIFNAGVAERVATFQTQPQSAEDVEGWLGSGIVVVAERNRVVEGFAKASAYDAGHAYYDGVAEATLYVAQSARRAGVGRALLAALEEAAAAAAKHKLIGKIFASNEPSLSLFAACGWTEVGTHRRHATLEGEWKDVVVVEKLLAAAAG
jgi:L-amino acid N-acyltransferase YncA